MKPLQEDLELRFVGTKPLLMHSGRLADPLDEHAVALHRITSKRAKTTADHRQIARIEWRGGLWLSAGSPCIPAEAIEAALAEAGRTRRAGRLVKAAVHVRESPLLVHDGSDDLEALFEDARFVHRCGVRVGQRRTMRTRPKFDVWSLQTVLTYTPSSIDAANLLEIAEIAGHMVGIGDFRPLFGRFRVEPVG